MSTTAQTAEAEPDQPTQGVVSGRVAAWSWIPSLYFAEGLPYVVVMTVSAIMYKRLGVSNADLALYTSLLYLPWVVKPLWSPLVDVIGSQRGWILATQALIAASMLGVAMAAPTQGFFFATLACFWVLAIGSATHDIAADGFYMAGVSPKDQAWFVGIRSSFYRLAMIAGSGLLVMVAGSLEGSMEVGQAWGWTFAMVAGVFLVLTVYHQLVLPRPASSSRDERTQLAGIGREIVETFASFFAKPGIAIGIVFLLLYRFSEAQLAKLASPFLLDTRVAGGLELPTETVGWLYGTVGAALLTLGGILGGMVVSRDGLKRWLLPMALSINLPNAAYLYLAIAQPTGQAAVGGAIAVEQFGYGFGFAAYMLYMLHLSRGEHQTAHYALCTGFMALGMMIPGLFCGILQESLGYKWFFGWVLVATIPSLAIAGFLTLGANKHLEEATA